ncbi:hypothetical protein ABID94_006771 [Streptomyces sp. PvR018]
MTGWAWTRLSTLATANKGHPEHGPYDPGGWCTGTLVEKDGARCMVGAIRVEARGDHGLEAVAVAVLLDAIHRKFSDADSVPSFNDSFASSRSPLRMLDQAAGLADTRGL